MVRRASRHRAEERETSALTRVEAFKARVTAVKELIEHHVEEEEEDLFPKVDKKLGKERLAELGAKMKARFEEVKSAGFAAAVPKGFGPTSADVSK